MTAEVIVWVGLLALALGLLSGILLHMMWAELRHDCLPHNPEYCRSEPGCEL